jgi:ATP-dependent Clp protease ATP-binding subunit ClpB
MAGKEELDEPTRNDVMGILRQHFRPEFLNRVDEIILFEPLRKTDIKRIVDIQVARMQKLLADKRLTMELTEGAETFLADRGYDPTYGARPLKRAIQKYLMDPLALKVLGGEYAPGDHILVDAGKDALTFGKGQAKAA